MFASFVSVLVSVSEPLRIAVWLLLVFRSSCDTAGLVDGGGVDEDSGEGEIEEETDTQHVAVGLVREEEEEPAQLVEKGVPCRQGQ